MLFVVIVFVDCCCFVSSCVLWFSYVCYVLTAVCSLLLLDACRCLCVMVFDALSLRVVRCCCFVVECRLFWRVACCVMVVLVCGVSGFVIVGVVRCRRCLFCVDGCCNALML